MRISEGASARAAVAHCKPSRATANAVRRMRCRVTRTPFPVKRRRTACAWTDRLLLQTGRAGVQGVLHGRAASADGSLRPVVFEAFLFQYLVDEARIDPGVQVHRLADQAVLLCITDARGVAGTQ